MLENIRLLLACFFSLWLIIFPVSGVMLAKYSRLSWSVSELLSFRVSVEQLLEHELFILTCLWDVSSEPHTVQKTKQRF